MQLRRSRPEEVERLALLVSFRIIPQKTAGSNPDGHGSHRKSRGSPLLLFRCAGFCAYRETLIMGAEIGYWARASSSGIMTNTVLELCELAKEAGYQRLLALVAPENEKSIRVTMRAGFVRADDVMRNGRRYLQFTKHLSLPEASS